jgi:hypothetical protein
MNAIRIGSEVEIYADADEPVTAPVSAFEDGSFETAVNGIPHNGTVTRSTLRAVSGTHAARVVATTATTAGAGVTLAPAPLQTSGQNPDAWDHLPTTVAGDVWRIQAYAHVLPGVQVAMRAALFTGPYSYSWSVEGGGPLATTPVGGSGWYLLSADYTPGVTGRWIGVDLYATISAPWNAAGGTWATQPAGTLWNDFQSFDADVVDVITPGSGGAVRVLVFSGRVTDLEVAYDDALPGPAVDVTAADFLADLANRAVGDEPWNVEPVAARIDRILDLAVMPGEPPIIADIAETVADVPMSWIDVDRQPAANLLTDVVQSVDAVLWSATHVVSGPYLRIEDPSARPAMYQLAKDENGTIVIDPAAFVSGAVPPLDLSACDLLRDPVTFHVDVGDVSTRARVEWQDQTTDDTGNPAPTSRTVLIIDTDREAVYGSRSVSVSTLLTNVDDATEIGERILARTPGDWRAVGITVADADFTVPDEIAADAILRLLNGVERGGLPVRITDMPDWSPIDNPLPGYVEGGEYTFTAGGWELALIVSRATGLGASALWNEFPGDWLWNQFDPALSWNNMRGVSAPSSIGV